MELKTGYKQTEVGVIPSDWKVFPLNYFLELLTDYDANGSFSDIGGNTNVFDTENFAWYVRATDLENEKDISHVKYVDEKTYKYLKKTKLFGNEVLITKRGEIGKVYFFKRKTDYATLAPNLYLLKLNDKIDGFYLYCFFKSALGQKSLIENNASTTLGALYKDDVKAILVPLPPTLAEQTAIATALSDTDQYITHLEKLIAKKRNIKQGAMQELLKPKEGWVVKKLGDYLEYEQPTEYIVTDTEYNDNNPIPVLTAGKSFILGHTDEEFGVFRNHPVIIFDDFTTATQYVDFDFKVKSSAMKILKRKNENVNLRFVYEIMQGVNYPMGIGDHKRHWIGEYQFLEIEVPEPIEQTRIATILTDMDTEIATLEKKLSKAQRLKQGMMQQLLTGKIRLV